MNTGMPQTPWPPRWARTLAFLVGIGLMTWETTVDQSAHLVAYGPAFLLTGLPIARGAEKFIDALPCNASGKILRRHLRDPYWAGKDRQVN